MGAARLQLSIEIDSDPISGSLSREASEPRAFCGWMELAEAIESVRHPEAELPSAVNGNGTLGQAAAKP